VKYEKGSRVSLLINNEAAIKSLTYYSLAGFGLAFLSWILCSFASEIFIWVFVPAIPAFLSFGLICGIIAIRNKQNPALSWVTLVLNVFALGAFIFTALLVYALIKSPRINP